MFGTGTVGYTRAIILSIRQEHIFPSSSIKLYIHSGGKLLAEPSAILFMCSIMESRAKHMFFLPVLPEESIASCYGFVHSILNSTLQYVATLGDQHHLDLGVNRN